MKKTGVKKIGWAKSNNGVKGKDYDIYTTRGVDLSISVKADFEAKLEITDWESGTTDEDKKKDVTWIVLTGDKKTILSTVTKKYNEKFIFKPKKKFSGYVYHYVIASISKNASKETNLKTGVFICGSIDNEDLKIVNSSWTTKHNATHVKENHIYSFGETIFLKMDTEGLNGREVTLEIYNKNLTGIQLVKSYNKVIVHNGEINLKINIGIDWKNKLSYFPFEKKDFFAKIKITILKFLPKSTGDDFMQAEGSRIYVEDSSLENDKIFKIQDKVVPTVNIPTNKTPTKIGEIGSSTESYAPCKFETITIKEKYKKKGKETVNIVDAFKKGNKLNNTKFNSNIIHTSIFFDFNKKEPDNNGKKILKNLLEFLKKHNHSDLTITGYACQAGEVSYNIELSKQRAAYVEKHFVDGGLKSRNIKTEGRGESVFKDGILVEQVDESAYSNSSEYKNEKNNENSRRVIVSYNYLEHNANTIVYEATAPSISTKKELDIEIIGFDTSPCFKIGGVTHKKELKVVEMYKSVKFNRFKIEATATQEVFVDKTEAPNFKPKIFSNLPKEVKTFDEIKIKIIDNKKVSEKVNKLASIMYLWPKLIPPNEFYFHAHSCRYFPNTKIATIKTLVYSDIVWDFNFSIGAKIDRKTFSPGTSPEVIKKYQEKREKEIKEATDKKAELSTGLKVSLKAKWENGTIDHEFTKDFEKKYKLLYKLFAGIELLAKYVMEKTGGELKIDLKSKGIPMELSLVPPKVSFKANWYLSHSKTNNQILGTNVTVGIHAEPLIGVALKIDLLGALVFTVSGAVSGGTAAPGVTALYSKIQKILKDGLKVGDDSKGGNANIDIYMDLIITGTMQISLDREFNTEDKITNKTVEFIGENKLAIEFKMGIKIKGEAIITIVKVEAFFEASAEASAGVTFGSKITFDDDGLFYKPLLGFDGISAKYIVKVSANASSTKKDIISNQLKKKFEHEFAKGEFKDIVPKFDVIEVIAEKLFNIKPDDVKVPLMRYKK